MQTQAKRFYVSGRVQGVGYRFFAERIASSLGMSGYVRNLYDGRVEVYAIGTPQQMKMLQTELERGPRMADVDGAAVEDAGFLREYEQGFSIEHDD